MHKIPSMSSKALVKLVQKGGAVFVRQGKTDHAIYSRMFKGKLKKQKGVLDDWQSSALVGPPSPPERL